MYCCSAILGFARHYGFLEGDNNMAQQWFFCKYCWKDRIFEWIYKVHPIGGHEEWHCTTCGGCDYDTAREH